MSGFVYLTFNDAPSGIFISQVTDVVKYLQHELGIKIRLISFISLRGFTGSRKRIKDELPDAMVLPMVPGVQNWRLNGVLLKLVLALFKPHTIISRSVLATQLALKVKGRTRVVYDGRGAIAAEWKEYSVVSHPALLKDIEDLERGAILESDFRIAVSHALVAHWKKTFSYTGDEHVIIPCTLARDFENFLLSPDAILDARKTLGFTPANTVFVYSGSISGWQGFELLYFFMAPILRRCQGTKLLLLSPANSHTDRLQAEFPGRVVLKHVRPNEVAGFLKAADYGLLIREQSVTNKVASPVKFAEYLACGLRVVISRELGDFATFVKEQACGNYPDDGERTYEPLSLQEKIKLQNLGREYFSKRHYQKDYWRVIGE